MPYSIGSFSKLVGLSIDTLRYYEKENLIICRRDANNRRVYDDKDVEWIEFIKRLKLTKMPIKDIKSYAALRYIGDDTVPDRLLLLTDQLNKLLAEQETLQTHIDFLNKKIDTYHQMQKR